MTQKEVSYLSQIRTNKITKGIIEAHFKDFMTVDKIVEMVRIIGSHKLYSVRFLPNQYQQRYCSLNKSNKFGTHCLKKSKAEDSSLGMFE